MRSLPSTPPATGQLRPALVPVSATLAANQTLDARRRRGEPVLPMAFGEAGLPAHRLLREELARAAGYTSYGPVAGRAVLREAAAGYWGRRGLPTDPDAVVCGPGSKALLFGLMAAIGGDVAVTRPSWVSYAAQASLAGRSARFVPGSAGVPEARELAGTVAAARAAGRPVRSVIITLPDNPTGTLAPPAAVRALCAVAERHDLIIISDEIYRDLVFDGVTAPASPASICPERTVVTTGLSKNLALGGWRLGVARLPAGGLGRELQARLLGVCSEIWSAPAGPEQQAAALAFSEPPPVTERVALSRRLHARVARAVAARFEAAGATVPAPQAAFYVYPDFTPLAGLLVRRHGISSDQGLAAKLLERYGVGVLPGSAFGEASGRLRLRVATAMLYGETDAERNAALNAADPCSLPWIAAALDRLEEVLADLTR
ncbi:MAG: pyridoxal phosphate-dependent aminotransferase [Streptosporangiaceae bacterium]